MIYYHFILIVGFVLLIFSYWHFHVCSKVTKGVIVFFFFSFYIFGRIRYQASMAFYNECE